MRTAYRLGNAKGQNVSRRGSSRAWPKRKKGKPPLETWEKVEKAATARPKGLDFAQMLKLLENAYDPGVFQSLARQSSPLFKSSDKKTHNGG